MWHDYLVGYKYTNYALLVLTATVCIVSDFVSYRKSMNHLFHIGLQRPPSYPQPIEEHNDSPLSSQDTRSLSSPPIGGITSEKRLKSYPGPTCGSIPLSPNPPRKDRDVCLGQERRGGACRGGVRRFPCGERWDAGGSWWRWCREGRGVAWGLTEDGGDLYAVVEKRLFIPGLVRVRHNNAS